MIEDIVQKHIKEAENVGLKYIGKSKTGNPNYRQYQCKEGHAIELQVQHVRRNNWRCEYCFEEELKLKAESIGYELLGKSDLGVQFRKYKKDCGCIEDLRYASVANTKDKRETNTVLCKICYRANLQKCADDSNITLLEDIDTYNIKIKFNSCGHYKDAKKSQVLRKNLVCRVCQQERFAKEAEEEGLVFNGYVGERNYSYTLPCCCEKLMEPEKVRRGAWCCHEHSLTHYNKPCDIYLNLGFSEDIAFVKVGIANDIFARINSYNAKDVRWANMFCVGFPTKYEALKYEKEFHSKFKHYNLDKKLMKRLMESGFTECYPMEAYTEISAYLSKLSSKFGGSVRFRKEEFDGT